jgi:hypothetical protein
VISISFLLDMIRGKGVDNLAVAEVSRKGLDSARDLSILSRLRLISGAARIRVAL